MRQQPLILVRIVHGYYPDGRCGDLAVEPLAATRRLLANHRCLLRSLPDGLQISTAVTAQGVPVIALPPTEPLRFLLRLTNPELPTFTDLTPFAGKPVPRFTNVGVPAVAGATAVTLKVAGAEPGNANPGKPPAGPARLETGVLAEVELINAIPAPGAPKPARYLISLAARQARWRYYLATDRDPGAGDFAIDAGSRASFARAAAGTDDPVAAALLTQYAGRGVRVDSYTSTTPLACAPDAPKDVRLTRSGVESAELLPAPSWRNVCLIDHQPGFYHVLRKLTKT